MPTLTTETGAGLSDANSYCSLTEAGDYLAVEDSASAWSGLTDQQKASLLIRATRLLDTYNSSQGDRATEHQALDWPRSGAFCRATQRYYLPSEVPTALKLCTALLALWLAQGNNIDQGAPGQAVNEVDVEGLTVKLAPGAHNASPLPKPILDILGKWDITQRRGVATIERV